ncbi:hypothetical protein J32TS6_14470 [Virgibacillus pantothenticus]|uniref:hypothetical protein n=1 Tax=Virgibacillus TaxID=84406 RepID=UPI00090C155F|nr:MULTISPECIES: hypothetical protein [Virgibacillus]API93019.1 hypothetical protein BKP57_15110 [Virgibacillus sp. 6R]MBS7429304.1 hypothetical protein [Virgibacillus sp. 19R1-5]GIP62892.1 hypothetical protein J32TS6_14470 [Virgibacillus pantothenticus]
MRIIWYEIRKLLNWKVLGLVLLISLLFFEQFLRFDFEHFPNGRPEGDTFNVTKQMINKYGQEMDEREFQDFKETYKEEVNKANAYLQSRDDFAEVGVTTYEQLTNMDQENENETINELFNDVMFDKGIDVFWELQSREAIIEYYEVRKEFFNGETASIDAPEWKQKILDGSINEILPSFVIENYNNLITMLSILIILSVMIVVGRIFIIDQQNNAIYLQYTTNIGRKLFKKKLMASMITSFLITSVYIGAFLILYSFNDTQIFFESSLHSFNAFTFNWLDMTFLQYIYLTIIGVYLLALVAAAVTTYLSRVVSNYISLIGVQVPIAVVLIILIFEYLVSNLFNTAYPMWITIGTYLGLLVLGASFLIVRWKKERKIDIV